MSTTFDVEGAAEANAVLAEAQVRGVQIKLSHRGAAAITLWALQIAQTLGSTTLQRGNKKETAEMQWLIPVQTDFPVMDGFERRITESDDIEYPVDSDRHFSVEDGIEVLANNYLYKIKAKEKKTITGGMGG